MNATTNKNASVTRAPMLETCERSDYLSNIGVSRLHRWQRENNLSPIPGAKGDRGTFRVRIETIAETLIECYSYTANVADAVLTPTHATIYLRWPHYSKTTLAHINAFIRFIQTLCITCEIVNPWTLEIRTADTFSAQEYRAFLNL